MGGGLFSECFVEGKERPSSDSLWKGFSLGCGLGNGIIFLEDSPDPGSLVFLRIERSHTDGHCSCGLDFNTFHKKRITVSGKMAIQMNILHRIESNGFIIVPSCAIRITMA